MPKCLCGAIINYGTQCYNCRTKIQKQDPAIKEVKTMNKCVIWYHNILKSENNKYTSSEIYNAFDMVWLELKKIISSDKVFNRMKFEELLNSAWDYGILPDYFIECADKIKSEHVPGKGMEMLSALGFVKQQDYSDDIQEVIF